MQGWEVTERQAKMDLRAELARAVAGDRVADHVVAWLDEAQSANTREAYARDALLFVRWLAARCPLGDVDRKTVSAYGAHVRGLGLANATAARRLATVSSLYTFMAETLVVEHNPAAHVRRPRVSKDGKTPAREHREMVAVMRVASLRDKLLVGLMYSAALRVTEMARAQASDLRTEKGRRLLHVKTKGDKERDVPIPPNLLPLLDAYLEGRADGPLLRNDAGEAFTRDQVARTLRKLGREAGIADPARMRPHVLRASAITNMLNAKKPLHDVRAMVGHANAGTTERYWTRTAGHDRDADLTGFLSEGLVDECERKDESA